MTARDLALKIFRKPKLLDAKIYVTCPCGRRRVVSYVNRMGNELVIGVKDEPDAGRVRGS